MNHLKIFQKIIIVANLLLDSIKRYEKIRKNVRYYFFGKYFMEILKHRIFIIYSKRSFS